MLRPPSAQPTAETPSNSTARPPSPSWPAQTNPNSSHGLDIDSAEHQRDDRWARLPAHLRAAARPHSGQTAPAPPPTTTIAISSSQPPDLDSRPTPRAGDGLLVIPSNAAADQRVSGYDNFLSGYLDFYDEQEQEQDQEQKHGQNVMSANAGPAAHANDLSRPVPPPHQHIHPSTQGGSAASRSQQERQSEQSNYSTYQRPRSRSPEFSRKPVPVGVRPQASPERELSPSPPMHAGIGPTPPSRIASWDMDGAYRPQPRQQHDQSQQPDNNYLPAAAAGGAAGAAAGYATSQPTQRSFSPPGNMGIYGSAAGYGGVSTSPAELNVPGYEDPARSAPFVPYRQGINSQSSYNSQDALTAAASPPGMAPPPTGYSYYERSPPSPSHFLNTDPYSDSPSHPHAMSREHLDNMVFLDPQSVVDDGDDGLGPVQDPKRASRISFGRMSKNGSSTNMNAAPLAAGAVAGAAVAGAAAAPAALQRNGVYASVPAAGASNLDIAEKTAWMREKEAKSRAWKKWMFIILGVVILVAIAAGTVGAVLGTRKSSKGGSSSSGSGGGSSGENAAQDDGHGDLGINSQEIKKLMNNPNLHKVFSGMAYTPFAAQYPSCITNPPSQNNITRDMAVLSQVTNVVRLYGTDCNQTQMVLHAIDRLQLKDMKIWLGVWLGNNQTTNDRQMAQMYQIIDQYGTDKLKGFVIGNEVLFRKDLTPTELGTILQNTKRNLTSKNINLPVGTSDLGDNWTQQLASEVDVVMSNVHPFFGGVAVDQAAAWTWNFWQEHDVILTNGMSGKSNIISEVGWPSEGGNDCSPASSCPDATSGAVSGISQMNQFMDSWVCQTLANGTDYFWFEAFDEPWKIQFDTPTQGWEDHWGLFDINRNLKKGLQIPTCGGKTVAKA